MGHRTMIMSVDTAHSLGDSLEVKLGPTPITVAENLDAFELDIIYEMRTKWSSIKDYVSAFMLSQGLNDISAEEMAVFPGMEMIAALLYVLTFEKEGKYDVVIIDTAPTGETLRLMSFPDVSNWYIDKLFTVVNKLMGLARFTIGRMVDFPLPSKDVMASIMYLKDEMKEIKRILENPAETTVRLVLNPERMAINETRRAYTYMCLYDRNVECLVVNKVIPDSADGEFMKVKLEEQKEYMAMIDESFSPLKVMRAEMLPTEMRGVDKLKILADMIFGKSDPIETYSLESPMYFESGSDGIDKLHMKAPFVDQDQVELFKGDDNTIIVHIGSQRRTVSLPMSLADAELLGAEFGDGSLVVRFRRKKYDGKENGGKDSQNP